MTITKCTEHKLSTNALDELLFADDIGKHTSPASKMQVNAGQVSHTSHMLEV